MFYSYEDAAEAEVDTAEAIAEIRRHGWRAELATGSDGRLVVAAEADGHSTLFNADAEGLLPASEILAWLGY